MYTSAACDAASPSARACMISLPQKLPPARMAVSPLFMHRFSLMPSSPRSLPDAPEAMYITSNGRKLSLPSACMTSSMLFISLLSSRVYSSFLNCNSMSSRKMSFGSSSFSCPPGEPLFSNTVTSYFFDASLNAKPSPLIPAPITAILPFLAGKL